MPTQADLDAMADFTARQADIATDLARNPPAAPPPKVEPVYSGHSSSMFAGPPEANEADVQRLLAGERHDIGLMLASNDATLKMKGEERQAAFKDFEADIRRQLGIARPVTPDRETQALAEVGRVPNAKPTDYKAPDLSSAPWLEGDGRTRVANAVVELAAANNLTQQTGDWVAAEILNGSAAVKGMSPEQRAAYWAEQDKIIERMSGGYVAAKDRLQVARDFLAKTNFGREAMGALLHNAGLVMTIWNLHQAEKQYRERGK